MGFGIYANSFNNDFLWDDKYLIVENNLIKDLSSVGAIFRSQLFEGSGRVSSFYRPMQNISYSIDYHLWRLRPLGYHITNTIIHVVNSILLFLLILKLVGRKLKYCTGALIAAMLYVVHPVHTQAVTYIAGRADLLALFFLLLSAIFYMAGERKIQNVAGAIFFILAILSKEPSVVFPVIFLIHDKVVKRNLNLVKIMPYLLIMVAYLVFRLTIMRFDPTITEFSSLAFLPRIFTTMKAFSRYLLLLAWPTGLHMERVIPISYNLADWKVISSGILIVFSVWLGVKLRGRAGGLISFGIFWFIIGLLPVSNILPLNAFISEHWLYIPAAGLAISLAASIGNISGNVKRVIITSLCAGVVILGGVTVGHNKVWRDGITFFNYGLTHNPGSYKLHAQLAVAYMEESKMSQAISEFNRALEIKPNVHSYNNLGVIYLKEGKHNLAINNFKRALKLDENFVPACDNIGSAYYMMRNLEEAERWYEKSLKIRPDSATAHNNLGVVYMDRSQLDKALMAFNRALALDPDTEEAKINVKKIQDKLLR
ncbi:tetratricopeptide repeat protein [Candidatus Omnitrophota bacterium]